MQHRSDLAGLKHYLVHLGLMKREQNLAMGSTA
jgi:hypothetical protein